MDILSSLRAIVGEANVLTDPALTQKFLVDWTDRFHGKVVAVVRPGTTGEVAAVVRLADETDTPVVVQGGGSSLVGGSIPDGSGRSILLSMARMNKVCAVDPVNGTMTVEAGMVLTDVQDAADEAGFYFPLSFGAEGSACIGGCLGTNAGGVAVLRYGNMRDLCLGIEVVTARGEVWNGLRGLRKDNTGYDLRNLFIGSEGTLGIITRAVLKLFPKPVARHIALVGLESAEKAGELLIRARAALGAALTGFELMERDCLKRVERNLPDVKLPGPVESAWWVLVEASAFTSAADDNPLEPLLEAAFEAGEVEDAYLAQSIGDGKAFWLIRESIPEADKSEGGNLHNDVSIPISRIPEFVDVTVKALKEAYPWVVTSIFGHLGDGNLHFNIGSFPANLAFENEEGIREIVYRETMARDGSISAEHGIGQLKLAHNMALKSDVELRLQYAIKDALDPKWLLNPGKLLAIRK